MMRLVYALTVTALLNGGCHSAAPARRSIILSGAGPGGPEIEAIVDDACAVIHTTRIMWPQSLPPRMYVLATDTERFERLWCYLRHVSRCPRGERGDWLVTLKERGRCVAEIVLPDDADRYPLWHGVLRELDACARSDYAYGLAYKTTSGQHAAEGEWRRASEDCVASLQSLLAGERLALGAPRFETEVGIIDDLGMGTDETLFWHRAKEYKRAVAAFRVQWADSAEPAIIVEERENVVFVTIDGEAPRPSEKMREYIRGVAGS